MHKELKTGDDVDIYCSRCKMNLAATIVGLDDGVPTTVRCNTCRTDRKYRAPKGKAGQTKKAATHNRKPTKRQTPETRWSAALEEHDVSQARPYRLSDTFAQGELLDHKKFGLGVIIEVLPQNKIRTLFREGEKVLVSAFERA